MNENPYASTSASESSLAARSKLVPSRWLTSVVRAAGILSGIGSWWMRLTIPAVAPGLGGPDPLRVLVVLGLLTLTCLVLTIWMMQIAVRLRSVLWGLLASVPGSFAITMLFEVMRR